MSLYIFYIADLAKDIINNVIIMRPFLGLYNKGSLIELKYNESISKFTTDYLEDSYFQDQKCQAVFYLGIILN